MSTKKIGGIPLDVFVKGGTTSTRHDEEKKRQYARSDEARRHQDKQKSAVAASSGHPGIASALVSHSLQSAANPQVVLTYKAKDHALEQDAICNIVLHPNDEGDLGMILVLVCPECLRRTGRQDDSQVMIKDWHRQFWLDNTRKGVWQNHVDGSIVKIAGTVTTRDICSCTALGCSWRFRIEDSELFGSDRYAL